MISTALASILVCVALMQGQAPESLQTKRPSFALNIALEHDIVGVGSEVIVDVRVKNVSGKVIHFLRVGSGPPQYGFKVLDQNGKVAPLTPLGEAMANGRSCYKAKNGETRCITGSNISQNPIAPGGTWRDAFPISYYVDFEQPGKYTIRLERSDPDTKLIVVSNIVVLTVARKVGPGGAL